jgi:hypothetical protein
LKLLDISGNPNIQLSHLSSLPTIDNLYIWGNDLLSSRDVRAAMRTGAVRHIHSREDYLTTYQDFAEYFNPIRRPDSLGAPPDRALPDALASHVCRIPIDIEEPVVGPRRSLFGKTSMLYNHLKSIDATKSYELDKAFPHFLVCLDDVHLSVDELLFPVANFLRSAAKVEAIAFRYAGSIVDALAFGMVFRNPEVRNVFLNPLPQTLILCLWLVFRLTRILCSPNSQSPPSHQRPISNRAKSTTEVVSTPPLSLSYKIGGVSSLCRSDAVTSPFAFVLRLSLRVLRARCAFAMYKSLSAKLLKVGERELRGRVHEFGGA